ncbi:EF2563 family selenium-dependent molybdenum hydroxylase system protein, partial [Ruminococcaceae bacterium OttesenSCG-928-D13]|nr:EF2563 family selenium-dependent molybdenum hydroxylase system protein [Ruminococcaceae bacterium OttesenSCG-928-D13]
FYRAGFSVLCLETDYPTAIRRTVALSEAVYDGTAQVEDLACHRVAGFDEVEPTLRRGLIPLLVDPEGDSIARLRPAAVVDAILAKRNLGTHRGMAPITIALGPGFCAGQDVDAVIETMRGHNLGRLYLHGEAIPNTGVPGEVGGQSEKRVIHAPVAGAVKPIKNIGDVVHAGEAILTIEQHLVKAPFTGLLRGLIRPGLSVPKGMKIADVDPRIETDYYTISDKARCLGGAALEAYFYLLNSKNSSGEPHDN